jgi:hypothetical protein
MQHLHRIGCLGGAPAALQHLDVEEAQRSQPMGDRVWCQLPGAEYRCLTLPDVRQAKLIGWTVKVPGVMLNNTAVGVNGGWA